MDPEDLGLDTPQLLALEDCLVRNYDEFDALRREWNREWQRAMVRRAKRRAAERARQSAVPASHEDDAA
jgi:hypothetical protein